MHVRLAVALNQDDGDADRGYPNKKKVYVIPLIIEGLKNYHDHSSPVNSGHGQNAQMTVPVNGNGYVSKSIAVNTRDVRRRP